MKSVESATATKPSVEVVEAQSAQNPGAPSALRRYVRSVTIGGLIGSVPFLIVLFDFGSDLFRTAHPGGIFSNFYYLQAEAISEGKLHVEPGTLGIEAFVVDGRHYMYFPPFPALLRLPLVWIGVGEAGQFTALSILLAWVVATVFVALLLWRLRAMIRPNAPLGKLENWLYGVFMATACGGSILVFLAALPWVYHEAYAWGSAAGLGALYSLLGVVEHPSRKRVALLGMWTLVAVLSRTPTGWACAVATLMWAAWLLFGRQGHALRRWWLPVTAAAGLPLLVGGLINFAKFRHPWLFPLDKQVWTELSQQRRDALDANGGHLIGRQFFTTTLINYWRPDGIRFTSLFPYVTLPGEPPRSYNGAFLDQVERTGSALAFNPALFLVSLTGLFSSFRPGATVRMARLRIPLLGGLGVGASVMFYGYLSHRYTADFFLALIIFGAVGLVFCSGKWCSWPIAAKRLVAAVGLVLSLFSVWANTATGVYASRVQSGGDSLASYVAVQKEMGFLTGDPISDHVVESESLAADAPVDELYIVGDCSALVLSTGDLYRPWTAVELRDRAFRITVLGDEKLDGPVPLIGRTPLLTVDGIGAVTLWLERTERDIYRLVVGEVPYRIDGPHVTIAPNEPFEVSVTADLETDQYLIEGPDNWQTSVPINKVDVDFNSAPRVLIVSPNLAEDAETEGLIIEVLETPVPPLCEDLRR